MVSKTVGVKVDRGEGFSGSMIFEAGAFRRGARFEPLPNSAPIFSVSANLSKHSLREGARHACSTCKIDSVFSQERLREQVQCLDLGSDAVMRWTNEYIVFGSDDLEKQEPILAVKHCPVQLSAWIFMIYIKDKSYLALYNASTSTFLLFALIHGEVVCKITLPNYDPVGSTTFFALPSAFYNSRSLKFPLSIPPLPVPEDLVERLVASILEFQLRGALGPCTFLYSVSRWCTSL